VAGAIGERLVFRAPSSSFPRDAASFGQTLRQKDAIQAAATVVTITSVRDPSAMLGPVR
jgi:hypothetical protein